MNDGLIPQRYAKALYKFADEKGNTTAVYNEMKAVVAAFESHPALQRVLSNPFVSREKKEQLLVTAAGDAVENDYRAFVKLILRANREEFAHSMALAYRSIYRRVNRIAQVTVTTAVELSEAELSKIKAVAQKSFKDVTLEFGHRVDSDIIGGFVIDVDSQRLDASISSELEQLRQNLLRSN